MGSSNIDVVITGDVEDQRHNPNWFVGHKYMLRPHQRVEVNKLGYFILKMPEHTCQPPTAFSPRAWRFGLHNRENLDSSGSEAVKLDIAVQYGLVGEKWVQFCDEIMDDPHAMLACYGLQSEVSSWTHEQIKHVLALDALFLATHIDVSFPMNERRLWISNRVPARFEDNDVFYARYSMWVANLRHELYRVENQIPFVLIDKVVEYICNSVALPTFEGNGSVIGDLQYQQRSVEYMVNRAANCFMATSSEAFKIDNSCLLDGKTHILGVAYKAVCGTKDIIKNQTVNRDEYVHIPSATKLKQSGIKIVGVDGPLCTMSYKNKCLSLPKMKIYDATFSFIRNMAWYENENIVGGCLFHDYIFLMMDLIQAREDLDLLIKHGVIFNACGIKGFEMWIALQEGLIEISSSQTHHDMKVAIVNRCGLRRYRLWSEFIIIFCSRPWFVLSTIVVILVTVATLIQTYTNIIGSNKMEPKFP